MRGPFIGVIGLGASRPDTDEIAFEIGREIACRGGVVVCGGLGGVMTAAARGAKEQGGFTVGILPGPSIHEANEFIDFPIASNMGQARNAIIVQTAQVLIAVGGGYGTLSEIALALKIGKDVVAVKPEFTIVRVHAAESPQAAVNLAFELLRAK